MPSVVGRGQAARRIGYSQPTAGPPATGTAEPSFGLASPPAAAVSWKVLPLAGRRPWAWPASGRTAAPAPPALEGAGDSSPPQPPGGTPQQPPFGGNRPCGSDPSSLGAGRARRVRHDDAPLLADPVVLRSPPLRNRGSPAGSAGAAGEWARGPGGPSGAPPVPTELIALGYWGGSAHSPDPTAQSVRSWTRVLGPPSRPGRPRPRDPGPLFRPPPSRVVPRLRQPGLQTRGLRGSQVPPGHHPPPDLRCPSIGGSSFPS